MGGGVGKYEEGRAAAAEDAVVGDAIADGTHGMFTNAEPDVAACEVVGTEVATILDVVFGRTVEVC